jgi:dTMP kinase
MRKQRMPQRRQGRLIVLDGIDGSGKGTQTRLLIRRLRNEGWPVRKIDFPRYGKKSAGLVEEFLHGKFGQTDEIPPKVRSIFYAVDRYAASREIRAWIGNGEIVVSDRYMTANLGHQGTAFRTSAKRKEFFRWCEELEYELFGIPRPDLTLILDLPAHVAYERVGKKKHRAYLRGKRRDINERNRQHLFQAQKVFYGLVNFFPSFKRVLGMEGQRLLTPPEVHAKVWEHVKKILP